MKRITMLLTVGVSLHAANLTIQQVQMMVKKIHERREGIELSKMKDIVDPFVRISKSDVEKNATVAIEIPKKEGNRELQMSLHAIMSGKAYINDGWKKVGDIISGYELKYIGKRGVVLRNGNRIRTLFLSKKNEDNNILRLEERK